MGIEVKDFGLDLDLLAYSGIVFSPEQRASLQTSLIILKEQYRFKTVHFWGKILGTRDDYFIAQGRQKNELRRRQYLYRYELITRTFAHERFVIEAKTVSIGICSRQRATKRKN